MEQEHEKLEPTQTLLIEFNGKTTHMVGQLILDVVEEAVCVCTLFLVEMSSSPYNVILGRPWIHVTIAVTSTYY